MSDLGGVSRSVERRLAAQSPEFAAMRVRIAELERELAHRGARLEAQLAASEARLTAAERAVKRAQSDAILRWGDESGDEGQCQVCYMNWEETDETPETGLHTDTCALTVALRAIRGEQTDG